MLKSLRLSDFKSFASQRVDLAGFTVLVGANAAGKSNLLDAIRLLQGVAMDMTLVDALRGRWEAGRQVWPGIRGGAAEAVRKGATRATLASEWTWGDRNLVHLLAFTGGDHPMVESEVLTASNPAIDLVSHARRSGANLSVALAATPEPVVRSFPATRAVLTQVEPSLLIDPLVRRACEVVTGMMRSAVFLDIAVSKMRDYAPKGAEFVGLAGENVSAVAWALCQDAETKRDLVDWLTELCAPELVDIDFSTTDLGDVMLILVEKGGRRIPARSLSDGTLRFLGELIALRTAAPGSMLLMEEIETGLHPTRVHLLVEAMEAATQARGVQVIATTHSPLVLNALSRDALRQAILVARPPDSAGTIVKPLGDLPDFDAIVERRGVDHLLASGWLERAL